VESEAQIAWKTKYGRIAINERNLPQPYPYEFSGDNSSRLGIRRNVYASLEWFR